MFRKAQRSCLVAVQTEWEYFGQSRRQEQHIRPLLIAEITEFGLTMF